MAHLEKMERRHGEFVEKYGRYFDNDGKIGKSSNGDNVSTHLVPPQTARIHHDNSIHPIAGISFHHWAHATPQSSWPLSPGAPEEILSRICFQHELASNPMTSILCRWSSTISIAEHHAEGAPRNKRAQNKMKVRGQSGFWSHSQFDQNLLKY